jgi:hypothetical protein
MAMKRLTAFFASLYLVLLLSAPFALAGEIHSGIVRQPTKGETVINQLLPLVLSLNSTIPLI